jgi:hypothetical protein
MTAARTFLFALVLLLAGCAKPPAGGVPAPDGSPAGSTEVSSPSASHSVDVTITGAVLAEPGCPGPQRAESPCPPRPVPGAAVELEANGTVIQRATTDASGRFRFVVSPGHYRITAHNVGYGSKQSQDLNVVSSTDVKLVVDSGLR